MKVIITGSRSITSFSLVETAMQRSGLEGKITQVALRGTSGIASLGKQYADQHEIPLRRFDPIWNPGGRRDNRAELTRDDNLAQYADAAVSVWDRKSEENQHLIRTMVGLGKETHVYDQSGDIVSETEGFSW
jgi:YspA, cpYpsA-related SLOG family